MKTLVRFGKLESDVLATTIVFYTTIVYLNLLLQIILYQNAISLYNTSHV